MTHSLAPLTQSSPVVAMLRVSTPKQDPARQRDMLARWCVYKGIPLDSIDVRDEGKISGVREDREVWRQIREEAKDGTIGTLLVSEFDRLGRSVSQLVLNVDELTRAGVKIVTLSNGQELDMKTPEGRLMVNVFAVLAQYERDRISQRVRAGVSRDAAGNSLGVSVRNGKRLGAPGGRWDQGTTPADLAELLKTQRADEIAAAVWWTHPQHGRSHPSARAVKRAAADGRRVVDGTGVAIRVVDG